MGTATINKPEVRLNDEHNAIWRAIDNLASQIAENRAIAIKILFTAIAGASGIILLLLGILISILVVV